MSREPAYKDFEHRCHEAEASHIAGLEAVAQVVQHAAPTTRGFLEFTLGKALGLTASRCGCLSWYDERGREIFLDHGLLQGVTNSQADDPRAGCASGNRWVCGEAVRQGKPVILNDVPSDHPLRRGCCESIAGLHRLLAIPVLSSQRVVATVVVADKETDYDQTDAVQLAILMDVAWKMVEKKWAEAKLRKTEERRRLALQGADLGTWDWDAVTGAVTFSRRWAQMLGYDLSEIRPHIRSWETLVHPDDLPMVMDTLEKHLRGGADAYETEHRLRHKSGRWVWVLDKGRVIERDADGRALRVCGTHPDVTRRKRAEEAIHLQADQYASILSTTTAGFWLLDESGRLLDVNENYCRMSGYTREELLAFRISDLEAAETGAQTEQHMRTLIAEGSDRFETRHLTRDGRAYDVEVSTSHWKKGGRVIAFVRDITDRKLAEHQLRESRRFMRTTIDSLHAHICVLDENGVILDVNQAWLDFAAANPPVRTNVAQGASYLAACNAAQGPDARAAHAFAAGIRDVLAGRRATFSLEYPCHSPGEQRWFRGHVTRFASSSQNLAVVAHEDITGRKLAEEALRKSQLLIEGIVQTIPARVFWKDQDLVYLGCNQAFAQDAGLADSKDIIGRDDYRLGWRDQAELYRRDDREVIAMGRPKLLIEEPQTTPEGKEITILTSKAPLRNSEGDIVGVIGTYIDITERIRAKKEAKEGEERNRRLVESSTDAIIIRSSDNELILYANPAAIQLFRANCAEEIVGRSYLDLVHPDDRAGTVERINRCREGLWTAPPREHRVLTLSGEVVDVESTGVPVLHQGETQIFGIFRDITERKKAYQEKEKLEVQLRQAQKMEAIGTLAGGIAHDFNNILSVIIGNSELLALRDEASPSLREGVEQILTAAQRAKQLVSQILTFSRQGEQEKLLVNLKPVVKETLGFLRASLPATIQLRHFIAPDAGVIVADPTQMQQVLMNLCTNAAHAMEAQGGVLKIDLGNVTIDKADGSRDPGAAPGNYLVLTVSDTGQGMDPRVQARIFDPYFTTKEPGKGTGLGLSVVHGIVRSHGGAIRVFSEVGKGTTFKVFLPRAEGVEAARPKTSRVLPRGTEKILLVDDEAGLAELGKRMLGLLGYQVEARTSPVAALEVFRAGPDTFDAVITDMTMPHLTGWSLAREILAIRPEIPIILCTGFSDQANEEKARSAGIRAFLFKPLIMQELATAVREAIDGPAGGKPPEQGQL
jgi:PAS domain S-box-containing protein